MTGRIQYSAPGAGVELFTADSTALVKTDAAHTADGYELFEIDAPRLSTPVPPHRAGWDCLLYALNGRATVEVDGVDYDLTPGSSLNIPARSAVACRVATSSARLLLFALTGANGRLFADIDHAVTPRTPPEAMAGLLAEVAARHDVSIAAAPAS